MSNSTISRNLNTLRVRKCIKLSISLYNPTIYYVVNYHAVL